MEARLTFEKIGEHRYLVKNSDDVEIGMIDRIRNGQWMHYSLVIHQELMAECLGEGVSLTFSPGCQDEIREFCKKLNGRKPNSVIGGKSE